MFPLLKKLLFMLFDVFYPEKELRQMLKIPDQAIAAVEYFTRTRLITYVQDPLLNLAITHKIHDSANCFLAKRTPWKNAIISTACILFPNAGFTGTVRSNSAVLEFWNGSCR